MNALIQPYIQGVQQQVVCPLYDPRWERDNRERFGRMTIKELEQANSFVEYSGRRPACGWILVKRGDYQQINRYGTGLQLQMQDVKNPAPPLTLNNLAVVQARCVSRGRPADPNAVYLVELTDRKGILSNRWFQFPTFSQYNIRSPAYPQQYYQTSMNATLPWTWDAMLQNLWNQMGTFLGPYPGLPITPVQDAEGWLFPGTSAWDALNGIVDHLGCSVASDLTKAAPYSIVNLAAADGAFTALQTKYAAALMDDLEYIDVGAGRVPKEVVVCFHRRNQYYGTEETIRNDALQWSSTPIYAIVVSAPAQFAAAAGQHFIWVEFTVQFDVNNNPLPGDVATAIAVANERAAEYYSRIYRGTLGFMHQTYSGVLPFATGSNCDVVRWRMRRHVMDGVERYGWVTEIMRGDTFGEGEGYE